MLGWELPPHNAGGMGVACYHLAKALASRGMKIDFMLPAAPAPFDIDFMDVHEVKDHQFEDIKKLTYSDDVHSIFKVQDKYLAQVHHYARTEEPPDVIHAHDWLTLRAGMLAKQLMNRPLVAQVHATEFDRSGGGYGNPIIHEIEQHGLMMADKIIAVSHYTKQVIMEQYGIPADKIDVLHNGFSLDDLAAADEVSYKYLDMLHEMGYTIVSTIGRLTLQKGLTHFLEGCAKAAEKHEKLCFVLAGDGEQRDELIARAAELGIGDKTIFTGFVRGSAWRKIYDLSDIFVMSSISEPFGITALEAAAHYTPIIITKSSGAAEVLGHALTYDYWDTDRLGQCIVDVATSLGLAKQMAEDTYAELDTLSWSSLADKCISTYQKAAIGDHIL